MHNKLLIPVLFTFVGLVLTQDHPINSDIVNDITDKTNLWIPYAPDENPLKDMSHEQLFGLLGTINKPPVGGMEPIMENADVPDSFDARVDFETCIHPIRDQ
jgi:hypothetical protein